MRHTPDPGSVAGTLTLEAERRTIGITMCADRALQEELLACGLTGADFADEAMGGIWRACLDVHATGDDVTLLAVAERLEHGNRLDAYGGPVALAMLAADCGTTEGWQSYVARVREASEKRQALAVARRVVDAARANGCTAADLRGLLQAGAEALTGAADTSEDLRWFDLSEAIRDQSPRERALVGPGLLFPGDLMVVFGPPKSQKSWLALDVCARWCLGHDWLGILTPSRPLSVAYLQFELRRDSWRSRVEQWGLEPDDVAAMAGRFAITHRCTPVLDDGFGRRLRRSLPDGFVPDMLVVDPLANIYVGNENDNAEMSSFLRRLRSARDGVNPQAAIMLVHHTAKVGKDQRADDPFASVRGASALRAAWDAAMMIDRPHVGSDDRVVQWELRNGREPEKTTIRLEHGRFESIDRPERIAGQTMGEKWDSEAARKMRALLELIRDEARAGRAWTANALAEEASQQHGLGSVRAVKGRLSELLQKHLLMGFDGQAVGLPIPPRYHGHLCTRQMMLVRGDGEFAIVSPKWARDTAGEMRAVGDEPPWAEFGDYYDG